MVKPGSFAIISCRPEYTAINGPPPSCLPPPQAILKHHTDATRYMSLIHRAEWFDYLLEYIASQKNIGIAEQLRLTKGISERRKQELELEIVDIIAGPHGSELEQQATYTLERAAKVPMDRPMLYVKTLLEIDYSQAMKLAGGIHLAAQHTAAGRDLLGPDHFAKLERKLLQHEKHLKLSLEQRWTKDQPEFKVIACVKWNDVFLSVCWQPPVDESWAILALHPAKSGRISVQASAIC